MGLSASASFLTLKYFQKSEQLETSIYIVIDIIVILIKIVYLKIEDFIFRKNI